MVNNVVGASELLLMDSLGPPGHRLGPGLNEVIYLSLYYNHYLNCHSAFRKRFMSKQFSPRDLLGTPWITTESGIIKTEAIVVIIMDAV